jgi:NADH:ubiquinone oxidoreductase subunit 5 (subunit L)/multisubunit Na+/H+ antiporter MnhA subunit
LDQYVVDGLVDGVGRVPVMVGRVLRSAQNGLVQSYALMMVLGLAALLLAVLRAWAGP